MTWLLVSDVDDTLTGDNASLARLGEAWVTAGSSLIVAYNSSRPCASLRETLTHQALLPTPDYLIGALGTEIENGRTGQRVKGYTELLSDGWQRDAIERLARTMGFAPHAAEYQTPLKASYDIVDEADYLSFLDNLATEGLRAKVLFSNRIKLDVVPEKAGKGFAIEYLVAQLGVSSNHVVVAGDSGNDLDMFIDPFRGIVVGNADDDLRSVEGSHVYFASGHHAAGVLEGLRHWGVVGGEGV